MRIISNKVFLYQIQKSRKEKFIFFVDNGDFSEYTIIVLETERIKMSQRD